MNHSAVPREVLRLFSRQKCCRVNLTFSRSIASDKFQITDAWNSRLQAPVFKHIKMAEYFISLDRKFTQEYRGSAVDVDIFANNVQNSSQAENMEELLHKLRRTPHTVHTLVSTHHAAIRAMLDFGVTENLVRMLDDRMNYGVFFDEYSALLVLSKLLESGDYHAGARCATQLMLQEEDFKLANIMANLASWKYYHIRSEVAWYYPDEITIDENPDDVIRVRVKTVPNNYHDQQFDLREPDKLLGKTLMYLNKKKDSTVSRSLYVLGQHLYGEDEEGLVDVLKQGEVAKQVAEAIDSSTEHDKVKEAIKSASTVDIDIDGELQKLIDEEIKKSGDSMINNQKQIYETWKQEREIELKNQYELMQRNARIESIEQTKKELASAEEKLFFFDKMDSYEMEKVEKQQAWAKSLPRTGWNIKNYPMNKYYKKKVGPDGEKKVARWQKREAKMGPPK